MSSISYTITYVGDNGGQMQIDQDGCLTVYDESGAYVYHCVLTSADREKIAGLLLAIPDTATTTTVA